MYFYTYSTTAAAFLLFFLTATLIFTKTIVCVQNSAAHLDSTEEDISLSCGSAGIFPSADGKKWVGDDQHAKIPFPVRTTKGSSTGSRAAAAQAETAPRQYQTARISRSQFSYEFQFIKSGPKCIRLHFNPVPYRGFQGLKDLFTVEAASFTLLSNFSASLTAASLGVKSLVKEFCVSFPENQSLNIVLYPDVPSKQSKAVEGAYAFINGIEIVSSSSFLGTTGVQMVGSNFKSPIRLYDHYFAFEIVHRQNVRSTTSHDFAGMFGMKETITRQESNNNFTWKISVDVGFRYLVRIHFSEIGSMMTAENNHAIFKIFVNGIVVDTNVDLLQETSGRHEFPRYKDYLIMMQGHRLEGRRHLLISLESSDGLVDRNGFVKGFEVLKLNNFDNNLASLNALPPSQGLLYNHQTLLNLIRICGSRNTKAAATIAVMVMVNIMFFAMAQILESDSMDEERKPSDRAQRFCRRFSLAEMQYATKDFHHEYIIGRGGFGKVYKGLIDNGQVTVAIKRLKYSSNQGEHEFWTEIETLSEVRHINLVSLIGYCNEQTEMILVYEYMACGTLADHIYQRHADSIHSSSLSWKKLLHICIGAGRGLDYLHTGLGIIHLDVKSSNILLDEHFVAKFSDFGLAKSEGERTLESSHVSTNVKGTFGFLDPDYFKTRKLTRKSDVYAFGAVLLEVLCGRPVIDLRVEEEKRSLTIWAVERIGKGEVNSILSSNLRGEISQESLNAFVRVAQSCLDDEPTERPEMAQVVLQLQSALQLQDHPTSSVPNEIVTVNALPSKGGTTTSTNSNTAESSTGEKHRRKQLDATVAGMTRKEYVSSAEASTSNSDRTKESYKNIEELVRSSHELDVFTYEEMISAMTRQDTNFPSWSYGTVYQGVINEKVRRGYEPTQVSITELYAKGGGLEERLVRNWRTEIEVLRHIRHPNIVKLIGYCCEDGNNLLVHEYMENGMLERHLFDGESWELTWYRRLKIALDIAKGLAFIHSLQTPIIHGDIRAASILLDGRFGAKLSSFGLAKAGAIHHTHITVVMPFPWPYMAPEYVLTGILTIGVDIYAFGVVLLELLTGRRSNFDRTSPIPLLDLVRWAGPLLENEKEVLFNMLDPRLSNIRSRTAQAVMKVARLASRCIHENAEVRPRMNLVVEILEPLVQQEYEDLLLH